MTHPQIIFIPVASAQQKIEAIHKCRVDCFQRKETLLFIAPDRPAAEFLDHLLWKQPEETFIPHSLLEKSSDASIGITWHPINLNNAITIFNLSSTPLLSTKCKRIYELEDLSSLEKKALYQKRYQAYREENFPISSLNL